jgi:hypothetical protein
MSWRLVVWDRMRTMEKLASTAADLSMAEVLENQVGLHCGAVCVEGEAYASRIPRLLYAGHLVRSLRASGSMGRVNTFRTY